MYSENRFEGTIIYIFGEEAPRLKQTKPHSNVVSPRQNWKLRVLHEEPISIEEISMNSEDIVVFIIYRGDTEREVYEALATVKWSEYN